MEKDPGAETRASVTHSPSPYKPSSERTQGRGTGITQHTGRTQTLEKEAGAFHSDGLSWLTHVLQGRGEAPDQKATPILTKGSRRRRTGASLEEGLF